MDLFKLENTYQNHPLIDRNEIEVLDNYYDIVLCSDVLESLIDPRSMVEKLSNKLKKGGYLIVSITNIREIRTLVKVGVLGDFAYNKDGGLSDSTHIPFFSKKNVKHLCDHVKSLHFVGIKPSYLMKDGNYYG